MPTYTCRACGKIHTQNNLDKSVKGLCYECTQAKHLGVAKDGLTGAAKSVGGIVKLLAFGPEKSDGPPLSPAVTAALEKGLTQLFGLLNFVYRSWKEAEKEAFLEKWKNWSPEERGRFVIANTYGMGFSGIFKSMNPIFSIKIGFLSFYLFISSLRHKVKQIPVYYIAYSAALGLGVMSSMLLLVPLALLSMVIGMDELLMNIGLITIIPFTLYYCYAYSKLSPMPSVMMPPPGYENEPAQKVDFGKMKYFNHRF